MKNLTPALLGSLCLLALLSACKSTNSVELFRINENGKITNIGRNADEGHAIYGHFRSTDAYDRAFVTIQNDGGGNSPSVCYIKLNDGQTNDGVGIGERFEPCRNATIFNEGAIFKNLDAIGIYVKTDSPWGSYELFMYEDGQLKKYLSRPVFDEHWQNDEDFFRIDPDDNAQAYLSYSVIGPDGSITLKKEHLKIADIKNGDALTLPPIPMPSRDLPKAPTDTEITIDAENSNPQSITDTTTDVFR